MSSATPAPTRKLIQRLMLRETRRRAQHRINSGADDDTDAVEDELDRAEDGFELHAAMCVFLTLSAPRRPCQPNRDQGEYHGQDTAHSLLSRTLHQPRP